MKPYTSTWGPSNPSLIASTQTVAAGATVILKIPSILPPNMGGAMGAAGIGGQLQTSLSGGASASSGTPTYPNASFTLNDQHRTITVSSTSGGTFLIEGFSNGKPYSEAMTVVGPAPGFNTTTAWFSDVYRVTNTGGAPALGVTVGVGNVGQTNWHLFDFYAPVANFMVEVIELTGGGNTTAYTFSTTNYDISKLPYLPVPTIYVRQPIATMNAVVTTQLANYTAPMMRYCLYMGAEAGTGSQLVYTYLQQGPK